MSDKDWKIEFGKALIAATVPTVLKFIFDKSKPKPMADIDWDSEYEKLLREEDKKRKKKKFPKLRKARE